MEPLEIAELLKEKFPIEVQDVTNFRDQVSVSVKRDRISDICRYLIDDPDISMDFLSDLCGVDYPERRLRFEVVYNLCSLKYKHRIRIKALIPEDDPSIDSVVPLWSGANWHEREACDMFGIVFNGHPDLRRILMPEDWEGYPLRKDYPLRGPEGFEYRKYEELKELHTHDDEWTIKS
ncbi:MAG TPA: NADH-quinone oxidoreductase subunit C [Nitrospirae bacterium]|nr:NADH-quinone oxidoreductase subunit C 1 [bacterium BMS3Abin10]GBE37760.1 NADH-quinone oxidoreductase subunit C 1 [bacterium BMS3Bbin08]HDH51382.1 NADH-quinone oxidoreductase subunit C [Nitrospirota bacterium]HDK17499.1 NADH-quinone oxidoreductase subunit C [Nitrospirota bacterium]HDK81589.1 NADH-quinone oxidoreductase subunit C [Nitrospirota bacterium]